MQIYTFQPIILYRKLTADRIFDGIRFRSEGTVLITTPEGVVVDLVATEDAGDEVQVLQGMLSPGLINCHCHLELSHLKGKIPMHTGLIDFVKHIMGNREAEPEIIQQAIAEGEDEMLKNGIVAVGDICNNTSTIEQKKKQRLHYHNFIEVSGFPPYVAESRFSKIKEVYDEFKASLRNNSIIPHAPYSVSIHLLKSIAEFEGNNILTMHNQEDEAENEFFIEGDGKFLELYRSLNVDISFHKAAGKSSLQQYLPNFPVQKNLLLVHNVHTDEADIQLASSCFESSPDHLFFCLCPNANLYIGGQLPNLELFRKNNLQLVLGTDSLASNHQLSIYAEIISLQNTFPQIPLEEMLKWATINGARALKIDDRFGSFEKGKQPGVVAVEEGRIDLVI